VSSFAASGCQRRMTALVSCGKTVVRKGYCQKRIDETVNALREQIQRQKSAIAQAETSIRELEGEPTP
jgi:hypothetical protein